METLPPIDKTKADRETDMNIISVQLKSGLLTLNKATGAFSLNEVADNLNPSSQDFNILFRLMSSPNYQATYVELIGGTVSKPNKRNFGFVLKNLKTALGILPTAQQKNEDIFENIKNYGYRLKN